MKRIRAAISVAAFVGLTSAASATTISLHSAGSYGALVGSGPQIVEDFEGFGALGEGEVGSNFSTDVGTFNTLGGTGSGGTVTGLSGNTGTELALRDGNTFRRVNTTPGGRWYLDSNDTWGMSWEVSTGSMFSRIVFTLADGSDAGGWLAIISEGIRVEQRTNGRLGDGNIATVVVDFGRAVSSALITIGNYSGSGSQGFVRNDGFSVDDISVNIAPVPLPAGLPLLLAGLGGLVALGRRRKANAA
ncbi:VPLPA-CTERM sorting domain-containing protein [Roseibacterium sp. SDUM158016]|nr:VPLPA-CTERM sorting domain-containing protein [Roseibacterium sp. SDUM158016]